MYTWGRGVSVLLVWAFMVSHCFLFFFKAFLPLVTVMTLMAHCVVTLIWHCVTWSMPSAALAGVNALRVSWKTQQSLHCLKGPKVCCCTSTFTLNPSCEYARDRIASAGVKESVAAVCGCEVLFVKLPFGWSHLQFCCLLSLAILIVHWLVFQADPDPICLAANVSTLQVLL